MQRAVTGNHSELERRINKLRNWYAPYKDDEVLRQIEDLSDKLSQQQLTLAFCGHFSAGKSSLINSICGKQIVASGPMPTTANTAAIRHGKSKVLLTPVDSSKGVVASSLDQMDHYCRDAQTYAKVEVWDHIPILGEHGVLLDTPGVDSGDQAHAVATESALHLADVVLYVMDYNHVLSESNLSFAKAVANWGKPLYFVINQIDKHKEDELSFDEYRKSVASALELWGINPTGVLYVSVKVDNHPLNQMQLLMDLIQKLFANYDSLLSHSVACSLHHGANQFLERCEAKELDEADEQGVETGDFERLEHEITTIHTELEAVQAEVESHAERAVRDRFMRELESILSSVQLMTPTLREAARSYLESRQSGFRMGLVFHNKKTELEKQRRSDELFTGLKEQIDAQLDWHVRNLLRQRGKSFALWDEQWEKRLEEELPQCESAWIEAPAKEGAVISGEYTLRYSAELAADVTGRYRRAALSMLDGLLSAAAPRLAEAQRSSTAQHAELLAKAAACERLLEQRSAAAERTEQLQALLGAAPSLTPGILPEVRDVPAQTPPHRIAATSAPLPAPAPGQAIGAPVPEGQGRLRQAAAVLEAAAEELAPHPFAAGGVRELRERALRLRSGSFTIALFGAFSAGKSSFANALLGAKVLPVSPHPTTAAINRIMAPRDGYTHGQALITYKTEEAMEGDLKYSFDTLELGAWNSATWRREIQKLRSADVPPSGRAHYSFLRAAAAGWEQHAKHLGAEQTVSFDRFAPFAAEESTACFVDQVNLYYSCPLTEQGVVIVDTPGADSIHARHTGVTFQYMKNCDALIYVTYFNHAFSQTDRQFLNFLGSVQNSFELDKMFFIVNAADLAHTPHELNEVVKYVEGGLRGAGIQSPQLYAVSSYNALQAKAARDAEALTISGMAQFEDQFKRFIHHELANTALTAAVKELHKWIERFVQKMYVAEQGNEELERMRIQLQADDPMFSALIQQFANTSRHAEIVQEMNELLFHIRRRMMLYASDLFHEYFHPGALQESKRSLQHTFMLTFRAYLAQLSISLTRELQAVCLLVEKKCHRIVDEQLIQWIYQLQNQFEFTPSFTTDWEISWDSPKLVEGMLDQCLSANDYISYCRSAKSFFEGGGRQQFRQALDQDLETQLKEAVEGQQDQLRHYYDQLLHKQLSLMAGHLKKEWDEWKEDLVNSDNSNEDSASLSSVVDRLRKLLEQL